MSLINMEGLQVMSRLWFVCLTKKVIFSTYVLLQFSTDTFHAYKNFYRILFMATYYFNKQMYHNVKTNCQP